MDVRRFINGKLQVAAPAAPCAESKQGARPEGVEGGRALATPVRNVIARETDAKEKLLQLVGSTRFVALSLPNCPQCDELAAFLASRGIPSDVFVKWNKSNPDYPELKAALAAHAGEVFSFPQVFADGAYQGGFDDVIQKAEAGVYDELFQAEFGVAPSTVRRTVEGQPMVVLSLTTCPQCDVLREQLDKKGLPTSDIFIKWDKASPQYQSLKSQLMEITGLTQFSFPQTFVRGQYEGGFDEMTEKVETGKLDDFFSEAFGISISVAAPKEELQAAVFDEDF